MKTQMLAKWIMIALVVLCSSLPVYAWLRRHFSDAEIVSRAELIVIGKIKENSMVRIAHTANPPGGVSWEHHVDLIVSKVLKGTNSSDSLIVSIHYGLDPQISSNGEVEIFDTGNSEMNFSPITGDIRTNHIWLLHHEQHPSNFDSSWIGIYDPEDIQPISKTEDLLKLLKQP